MFGVTQRVRSFALAAFTALAVAGALPNQALAAPAVEVVPALHVGVGVRLGFDPWVPGAVGPARAGYLWVPGHYDMAGFWVAGHYRPVDVRPGYVYEPGYWRPDGVYVDGAWRFDRAHEVWVPGHYVGHRWEVGHWRVV